MGEMGEIGEPGGRLWGGSCVFVFGIRDNFLNFVILFIRDYDFEKV